MVIALAFQTVSVIYGQLKNISSTKAKHQYQKLLLPKLPNRNVPTRPSGALYLQCRNTCSALAKHMQGSSASFVKSRCLAGSMQRVERMRTSLQMRCICECFVQGQNLWRCFEGFTIEKEPEGEFRDRRWALERSC